MKKHNEEAPSSVEIFLSLLFSKLLKWSQPRSLLCATRPTACTCPWLHWSTQIRLVDCPWTPSTRWSLSMTTCSMLLSGCYACCRGGQGRNKDLTVLMLFLRRQSLTAVATMCWHRLLSIIYNCEVTEVSFWAAMNMARAIWCCLYNTVDSSGTVNMHIVFMDFLFWSFFLLLSIGLYR